jgi:ERCC4-type nuclease
MIVLTPLEGRMVTLFLQQKQLKEVTAILQLTRQNAYRSFKSIKQKCNIDKDSKNSIEKIINVIEHEGYTIQRAARKLTSEQVESIIGLSQETNDGYKVSQVALAERFGVTPSVISKILKKETPD